MSQNIEKALQYVERGWRVLPLHYPMLLGRCSCGSRECHSIGKHPLGNIAPKGLKEATTDKSVIQNWFERYPEANIGIATGQGSGILVLDIDTKGGRKGEESLQELENEYGVLPETIEVVTGSGGRHIYFQHPGNIHIQNKVNLKPGLDIRGDEGYVVAPPSRHASGNQYQWRNGLQLDDVFPAALPEWLLPYMRDGGRHLSAAPDEKNVIPEGERNNSLFHDACRLRGQGLEYATILEKILALNQLKCQPPLDEKEVVTLVESACRYDKGKLFLPSLPLPVAASNPLYPLTDIGNAERFRDRNEGKVCFNHTERVWLIWDEVRWKRDETEEIYRLAKETIRSIALNTSIVQDSSYNSIVACHARNSEARERIRAMVELAKSELPISHQELDTNQWRLNVANGTLDLRTGELLRHNPADYITKLAPVEFVPDAGCSRWIRFLLEVFEGNEALIRFLQKAIGYSLTGDTREQVVFFLYGKGANGKSTFLEIIRSLMGQYGKQAEMNTFLAKDRDGARNDIAELQGVRFVAASEIEEGRRLDEVLIKQLTGNDTLKARFLYKEYFEFKPEAKIFFALNHKPVIRGTDIAIWRRIRLIPFNATFPEDRQEKGLQEQLLGELSGILNWALEGCLAWQKEGLQPPSEILTATTIYRTEMDTIGSFISKKCILSSDKRVSVSELYAAYQQWCQENGERWLSQREFSIRLGEGNYGSLSRKRGGANGAFIWQGIGIDANQEEPIVDVKRAA